MKSNRQFSARKRGFTLIELLVVILILAILAAMIVPRIVARTSDAKQAKALADLANLSKMIETFRLDCDRYPTTEEGLNALREAPADANGWKGPYSSKPIPLDPWGGEYYYEFPGVSGDESFVLMSLGADGQEGGEGDSADIIESE